MANYPTRDTIELVHGSKNTLIWADLDNDKDSVKIDERIDWACELATEYINSRLIMGKYAIPFTAVPKIIVYMSSLLGGILLHDGRMVVSDEKDKVRPRRKEFKKLLRELLSGQMRLIHPTTSEYIESTSVTVPSIFPAVGSGSGLNCCNPYPEEVYGVLGICHSCSCRLCICRSLRLCGC